MSLVDSQFPCCSGWLRTRSDSVCTLMVVPIIAVFFFAQRTFIQGVTLTGLKE